MYSQCKAVGNTVFPQYQENSSTVKNFRNLNSEGFWAIQWPSDPNDYCLTEHDDIRKSMLRIDETVLKIKHQKSYAAHVLRRSPTRTSKQGCFIQSTRLFSASQSSLTIHSYLTFVRKSISMILVKFFSERSFGLIADARAVVRRLKVASNLHDFPLNLVEIGRLACPRFFISCPYSCNLSNRWWNNEKIP